MILIAVLTIYYENKIKSKMVHVREIKAIVKWRKVNHIFGTNSECFYYKEHFSYIIVMWSFSI